MTKIKVTGNKVSITEAMETHIDKKFSKVLESLLGQVTSMTVHFSKNNNSTDAFKVNAELKLKGATLYAEEFGNSGEEFYGMIDELASNIERQVNKRKTRYEADKKKGDSLKRMEVRSDEEEAL